MTTTDEEDAGRVNALYSVGVQYGYSDLQGTGLSNTSRPVSETYPDGRKLDYVYTAGSDGTGIDTAVGRVDGIRDDASSGSTGGSSGGSSGSSGTPTPLVAYTYLGLGTVVTEADGNGITLSYVHRAGDTLPAYNTANSGGNLADYSDNRYTGLDRFGRVDDQYYTDSSGTTVERLLYGYDMAGNALYREDATSSASNSNNEIYAYDALDRLVNFRRGSLNISNTGLTGTATRTQTWSLDALGNWNSSSTNGTASARTNNAKNQITASNGSSGFAYDANGNLLTEDLGGGSYDNQVKYTYDAWNRAVTITNTFVSSGTVYNQGTTTLSYSADGRAAMTTNTGRQTGDLSGESYFDSSWRLVETDNVYRTFGTGGVVTGESLNTAAQYVWGLTYVNDLIERDDIDSNGRYYALRDANHDVVGITNSSGSVAERFDYDPYGTRTTLTAGYAATANDTIWTVGFQGGVEVSLPMGTGTTLVAFQRRIYDAAMGRWDQADPAGYVDGANRYLSNQSNPIKNTDASGLFATTASNAQWHHLLPQRIFDPAFLKENKLNFDIHDPRYGWVIDRTAHQTLINPTWNQDWNNWIASQKAAGTPITQATIDIQLQAMVDSPAYKAALKQGGPAKIGYGEWSKVDSCGKDAYLLDAIQDNSQLSNWGRRTAVVAAFALINGLIAGLNVFADDKFARAWYLNTMAALRQKAAGGNPSSVGIGSGTNYDGTLNALRTAIAQAGGLESAAAEEAITGWFDDLAQKAAVAVETGKPQTATPPSSLIKYYPT